MNYNFVKEKENYQYLSSGSVLYSIKLSPAFPVRLGSEIFQRATEFLEKKEGLKLYDPCCGAGYLITTLGILHGKSIKEIIGSDIENELVTFANKNLSLLNTIGQNERRRDLEDKLVKYGKSSYEISLKALGEIEKLSKKSSINTSCFFGDALNLDISSFLLRFGEVDLIISDLPYDNVTSWNSSDKLSVIEAEKVFLSNMVGILKTGGIIVLITSKKNIKITNTELQILSIEKIGKRKITFFKKNQ